MDVMSSDNYTVLVVRWLYKNKVSTIDQQLSLLQQVNRSLLDQQTISFASHQQIIAHSLSRDIPSLYFNHAFSCHCAGHLRPCLHFLGRSCSFQERFRIHRQPRSCEALPSWSGDLAESLQQVQQSCARRRQEGRFQWLRYRDAGAI